MSGRISRLRSQIREIGIRGVVDGASRAAGRKRLPRPTRARRTCRRRRSAQAGRGCTAADWEGLR